MSLHGDLDVSQIDELPPGRTPIKTAMLPGSSRDEAYQLIRDEVNKASEPMSCFLLVEDSEKMDLRSAVEVHRQLAEEVFPDLQVGLLHGRLASADKQAVIRSFAAGESQVLVSTTVVEVGVDVPEASVMVIDHADRFGLAQLHQLRGRVGRGAAASHCLLINDSRNPWRVSGWRFWCDPPMALRLPKWTSVFAVQVRCWAPVNRVCLIWLWPALPMMVPCWKKRGRKPPTFFCRIQSSKTMPC